MMKINKGYCITLGVGALIASVVYVVTPTKDAQDVTKETIVNDVYIQSTQGRKGVISYKYVHSTVDEFGIITPPRSSCHKTVRVVRDSATNTPKMTLEYKSYTKIGIDMSNLYKCTYTIPKNYNIKTLG